MLTSPCAEAPVYDRAVVAVGFALLDRVAGHQPFAIRRLQQTTQQNRLTLAVIRRAPPLDAIGGNQCVDCIPLALRDDGLMLAGETLPLVHDLAQVPPVVQHLVEGLLGEGLAPLVTTPSAP